MFLYWVRYYTLFAYVVIAFMALYCSSMQMRQFHMDAPVVTGYAECPLKLLHGRSVSCAAIADHTITDWHEKSAERRHLSEMSIWTQRTWITGRMWCPGLHHQSCGICIMYRYLIHVYAHFETLLFSFLPFITLVSPPRYMVVTPLVSDEQCIHCFIESWVDLSGMVMNNLR